MLTLDDIEVIFRRRGGEQYSGEPVTQLEHALQAAALAEAEGADDEIVSAALLHDLGHLVHELGDTPSLRGVDDVHQYIVLPFLRRLFPERVLDAIKLHVDAKRYLCATRHGYHDALSADSKRSLVLQGGTFDTAQAAAFAALPGAQDAVRVRLWDDLAKTAGAETPPLAHFIARAALLALLSLTGPVLAAVLCGALLHAGWNALVKSAGDKTLDTALVHFMGALIGLPLLLWLGPPPRECWPFIGASLVIHIGYYIALAGAYQHGELGMTYPIMRGFAPLLVALASGSLIGEAPSTAAWLGTVGITVGVALVGLAHPGEALHHRKALAFAFANAGIIAVYTVIDGLGVRASGDALRYVVTLFVLDGWPFPLLVAWQRGRGAWPGMLAYARRRWPLATVGGAASAASYGIALWAMTRAPVASVAALRETSVLFAALLGTWLLKERFGLQRAAGTVVVVAGVMALRLG